MTLRVAVLGGGISGLASAIHVAQLGAKVVLYESEAELGGLGASFETQGVTIERFYHCLLPSDRHLLSLLERVGLAGEVVWRPTGMGFMVRRRVFPLNSALDLLRFEPLTLAERLRLGWMGLRVRAKGAPAELDAVTVRDWVTREAGAAVYRKLWKPLLESKLGDAVDRMPALWLASRIAREKGSRTEVKGFVPGGYRAIVARIAQHLTDGGAEIRLRTRVEGLRWDGERVAVLAAGEPRTFDAVVCTAPLPELRRWTAPLDLTARLAKEGRAIPSVDYQGVVNAVFLLKSALTPYYWMPIVDSGVTCQGIVETSNLVPPERTRGLHVAYLLNYVHRSNALYGRPDADLLEMYRRDLETLFPAARGTVEAAHLFRAPFVEPLWHVGYKAVKPPATLVPRRLYLVSTAQVYPRINAWDSCCEAAETFAREFSEHHRGAPRSAAPMLP